MSPAAISRATSMLAQISTMSAPGTSCLSNVMSSHSTARARLSAMKLRGCLEWARPSWIPPEPLRRIGVALAMRKHVREVAKPRPHG